MAQEWGRESPVSKPEADFISMRREVGIVGFYSQLWRPPSCVTLGKLPVHSVPLHFTLPGIPPLEIPPGPWFDAPIKMKMLLRELNAFSHSVQFSCSVMSDSLRPMTCSTPGFPVHHQLPELAQPHVH